MCADRPIEGIPLDWGATGLSDSAEHIGLGLGVRRGCAGHMENVFFVNGAVEVVGAIMECDLGELSAEADPVGGDMRKVIEEDPAGCDGEKRIEAGGRMFDGELVVAGLIRERDEGGEAVGFVLEFAELAEVMDPIFRGFDVAVEHGAGALTAEAMPLTMYVEVFLGGLFSFGDRGADFFAEDFCSPAGERVETC